MQSEAIFENISNRITQELSKAEKSIIVAVAWFTNNDLFSILVKKAESGCKVSLILSGDSINIESTINYSLLLKFNSKVYFVGDGNKDLMHNKFCIIDYSTVITGSFNWSYKAERNFENIIITYSDTNLAEQFLTEFNLILKKYYPEECKFDDTFPFEKIFKRLEILRNYIVIEEYVDVKRESSNLKKYDFNSDIKEIVNDIENEEFASAITKIQNFISKSQQLTRWLDPVISALKLEIRVLENKINAFDNEKTELEKLLSEFQHRHSVELGHIIIEILRLRKKKVKNSEKEYKEAVDDENEYKQQFEFEKEKFILTLSTEEASELKKTFRKATILCHPDKFVNEPLDIQKKAEEIFKELNEANAKNDLKRVRQLLSDLEKGILTTKKGDSLQDRNILNLTIQKLREKAKFIENQIISIKQSETYKTIIEIENWDIYFVSLKSQLTKQLESLKKEVGKVGE